jgi:DNA-binding response OmpR family regulator
MMTLSGASAPALADIEVDLVHWSADDGTTVEPSGTPRLWLVEPGLAPPKLSSALDDWIRLPADPIDLQARVANLRRAAHRRTLHPKLDEDGMLRRGRAWIALRPVETILIRTLLDSSGHVVGYDALQAATWPQGPPSADALHDRMGRVGPRLRPLGLLVHRVRGKGYMVELSSPPDP